MNAICAPKILHSFNIWLYKLMNVDITMLDQNIKWKIVRCSSFWVVLSKLRDNMGNHKDDKKTSIPIRLGLRANINQFSILVLVNAFVGAMIGLEQTVVPFIGKDEFGIESNALIVSFIASFGAIKAILNLFAGSMSDRWGRKRMLVLGWLFGIPVPFILLFAPDWNWIIFANVLLGINQGLAWSMTVNMKIDLVGKERRGLALGLNEFAGYVSVAVVGFVTGYIAAIYGLNPYPFFIGIAFAVLGTLLSRIIVRDTKQFMLLETKNHDDREHKESGLTESNSNQSRLTFKQVFAQ